MTAHMKLESDASGEPTKNYLIVSTDEKCLCRLVVSPENTNPLSPGKDWYFVHVFDDELKPVAKKLGTKKELRAEIEKELGQKVTEV